MMATLYLDRKHSELRYRDRRLQVRRDGALVEAFPLAMVERVVVAQHVDTDTRTLAKLAAAGISVTILPGRSARNPVAVVGLPGNDARRRLAQYAAWCDPGRRRELVRELLLLKFSMQIRFVNRLQKLRDDRRRVLTRAQGHLLALRRQLRDDAPHGDLDALRGLEGAASAAAFRALQAVLPPQLGFTGRRRRPPPDPVNAVLSLAYMLACSRAQEAVLAAGFDPAIGFLHAPAHDRPSLALDFVEPLRPQVDRFVWELFRKRLLTGDHFRQIDGGCRLGKRGRAIFFQQWEHQVAGHRRWLRYLARALVMRLMKEET